TGAIQGPEGGGPPGLRDARRRRGALARDARLREERARSTRGARPGRAHARADPPRGREGAPPAGAAQGGVMLNRAKKKELLERLSVPVISTESLAAIVREMLEEMPTEGEHTENVRALMEGARLDPTKAPRG